LWDTESIQTSGAGTAYVTTETHSGGSYPGIYVIHVVDSEPGQSLPLTVTITYNNGLSEVHHYQIVEELLTWLPLVNTPWQMTPSAHASQTLMPAAPRRASYWTEWTEYGVGTDDDQRWYDQIAPHTPPNTKKCWSGCGPTAWAMLFGWADNQAAKHRPYWEGRWGIYRAHGGYGSDAVAPATMDDGVANMIWEINRDVDTFCVWSAVDGKWLGATWASHMDDASDYLNGRSHTRLFTWGNNVSIPWPSYRDHAVEAIRRHRSPAVIGIGAWAHYPLAYRYAYRHWRKWGVNWWTSRYFYVNQGWGSSDERGWVWADIWFAGVIRPYAPPTTNIIDDVALFSTRYFYWRYDYGHTGTFNAVSKRWGQHAENRPLAGDFDRDGIVDDLAVYRPSTHHWSYDYNHDGTTDEEHGPWGWEEDLPIAGDFDRDGFVDDVAVYRPSTHIWYYDYDHDGDTDERQGPWGVAEDRPFSGDFDADGRWDDVAVYRPSSHVGYYDYNHDGNTDFSTWHWGTETGWPIAADFDGDGFVDDIAIFVPDWRPEAVWFIDYDHDTSPNDAISWGNEYDLPVAGAFADSD